MTNIATKLTNTKVYIYTIKLYKQIIIIIYKVLLNTIILYIKTNKKHKINIMNKPNTSLYHIQPYAPYFPKIKKIRSKKKLIKQHKKTLQQ